MPHFGYDDFRAEIGLDEREKFSRAAADGIAMRAGLVEAGRAAPGAEELRGRDLVEIARMCLARAGIKLTGDKMRDVGLALTERANPFPQIMAGVANKALLAGFADPDENTWSAWVDATGSVPDFKLYSTTRT